jgi:hypothetical protein
MSVQPTLTRTRTGAELRFPFDRLLVDALKAEIPAHGRSYDPDRKVWTVTPAYVAVAFRLMHLTFADVEIEDIRESGRRSADRAPQAGDPYVVLHLRETAPPELVTAAYRCLARLHHPDRGGSTATMQAINAAAEQIRSASR